MRSAKNTTDFKPMKDIKWIASKTKSYSSVGSARTGCRRGSPVVSEGAQVVIGDVIETGRARLHPNWATPPRLYGTM
jgi:hypothetical protein